MQKPSFHCYRYLCTVTSLSCCCFGSSNNDDFSISGNDSDAMKILDRTIILTTINLSKSRKLRAFVALIFLVKPIFVMRSCIYIRPKKWETKKANKGVVQFLVNKMDSFLAKRLLLKDTLTNLLRLSSELRQSDAPPLRGRIIESMFSYHDIWAFAGIV